MVGSRRIRVAIGALGVSVAALAAPVAAAEPVLPEDPAALSAVDVTPVPGAAAAPPDGVSHLPSLQNLPPGTTQTPPERRSLGYLRDVWQVIRTEDVTMSDALMLLAQRPMSSQPRGRLATSPPAVVADPVTLPPPPTDSAPPASESPPIDPSPSAPPAP